jgi:hypothetical protein
MGLARLERETQRLAGTEEVSLTHDIIEGSRAQPVGEGRVGFSLREEIRARR